MADLGAMWIRAMRAGRYPAAWAISRRVLRARDPAGRDDPALPYHRRWLWDGRPLAGRDVLVRCYQGLGDTIMFARFLPLLARRARSVTVEAPPALLPLLRQLSGVTRLIAFDPARPTAWSDADVEICELAVALRAAPEDAPPPYLSAPPADLPPGTIGLCHMAGEWDRERHVPLPPLIPLCRSYPCITLVAAPTTLPVDNPEGCPLDMTATAAAVAGSALVITVDTMIAHLAGALGRPVWLLLKADPDWRWVPHAGTSAWYPTTRTFTQRAAGDWTGVLAAVEEALARGDAAGVEKRHS